TNWRPKSEAQLGLCKGVAMPGSGAGAPVVESVAAAPGVRPVPFVMPLAAEIAPACAALRLVEGSLFDCVMLAAPDKAARKLAVAEGSVVACGVCVRACMVRTACLTPAMLIPLLSVFN